MRRGINSLPDLVIFDCDGVLVDSEVISNRIFTESLAEIGVVRTLGNENIAAHERLIAAELSLVPAVFLRLACRPLEHLLASRRPRARASAGRVLQRVRARDHAPTYRTVISVDIASRQTSQLARHRTE